MKGRRQKAKGKSEAAVCEATFAFCLLPFDLLFVALTWAHTSRTETLLPFDFCLLTCF